MKKNNFLFIVWCLSITSTLAQPVLENNPPSVKWSQVSTPHFNILHPAGYEQQGQRIANTLEWIYHPAARTLGVNPPKIFVILQNRSSFSNGFVSITPRRSEFYGMPTQDYNFTGTNDWFDLLASHEYRHIVQFQQANRGVNRLLFYLFGQNTLSGMAHAAVPDWFWEGDAVVTETALTPSGRGRIPNFGLVFKTNLVEGRKFNYHKQYLGSYKHNIPNEYVLGYHMVGYLRKRTNDPLIWEKITARAWGASILPFTFSNAIKKESGLHVTDLYKAMANELQTEWKSQIDSLQLTPFEKVNPRKTKAYTDYMYPQPLEDGSILAMKSGIGDIEKLVAIKDGQEKKVFVPGIINRSGMLSAANSRVVWNEYRYDPRWRIKSFSVIKAFDAGDNHQWTVPSSQARFAGAALSPNGYNVATIRTDHQYQHTLLVLDIFSGKVLKEFSNPENHFYSMPRWSDDGKKIVVLKTTPQGRTISLIDYESGIEEDVLPISNENVGHPVMHDNYVFYNSPYTGIDNVYVLNLETKKRFRVTNSRYGASNPSISKDGKTIYYNDQTRDGMDIVKVGLDPANWVLLDEVSPGYPNSLVEPLVKQEGHEHLFDSIPTQAWPVKKYSKIKGLINPYSWGAYIDTDLTQATLGISSRDILSTTSIDAGYVFDIYERTGLWRVGASYQGWYPIVDASVSFGERSVDEGDVSVLLINASDSTRMTRNVTFKWSEQTTQVGLRIPLITTTSKYHGNFSIGNSIGITKVNNLRNTFVNDRFAPAIIRNDTIIAFYPFFNYVGNGTLAYNHFTTSAFRLLKRSHRDINSKWGQAAFIHYYNTPYGGDFSGSLFSFTGYLYFPGFLKHHSLHGYWAYQLTQVSTDFSEAFNDYFFRNTIPVPRGQSVSRFREFYSMSVNYTFPLWYPDIALGPFLNIQRVRMTGFLDYGAGQSRYFNGTNGTYTSVGGEVKVDINIGRWIPQIDIGFRYAQGLNPVVSRYEVLIGTINF